MFLLSCAGTRPTNLGVSDSKLAPCPPSPNCVSSDADGDTDGDTHKVSAFVLDTPSAEAWQVARELVSKLPRTHIIKEEPEYLHAECASALFGFVDDLELHLRSSKGIIAVRSASRLGHSDFGVNRQRVETLRSSFINRGIVRIKGIGDKED
jgi:uncharacterized protein (DUF1499 family)